MKLRAAPVSVQPMGCSFTGRRFHSWALSFIDPMGAGQTHLERKCVDCNKRQHADAVPDQETRELPRTLWCLIDWPWHDGAIEP